MPLLAVLQFLLIVFAVLSGIVLYLYHASADDWWNLVQVQIMHEVSLICAVILLTLRASPGHATETPTNGDREADVGVDPNFECPKGRDGRPLLH